MGISLEDYLRRKGTGRRNPERYANVDYKTEETGGGGESFIERFLRQATEKKKSTEDSLQEAIETVLTSNRVSAESPAETPSGYSLTLPGPRSYPSPIITEGPGSNSLNQPGPRTYDRTREPVGSDFDGDLAQLDIARLQGGESVSDRGSILDQIDSILSNPTSTPDRWISPYNQDQLNLMGNLLAGAGSRAAESYRSAIPEILANAQQGLDQRAEVNSAFVNELAANAANLDGRTSLRGHSYVQNPINYAQGAAASELAAAAGFLDEVGRLNTQADVSYNQNLANNIQTALNAQAALMRAGLLTERQFVPGDSGISEADKIRISLLRDELGRIDDSSDAEADFARKLQEITLKDQLERELAAIPEVKAKETEVFRNPEFEGALTELTNPRVRELVTSYYNRAGNDVVDALAMLQEDALLDREPATSNIFMNPLERFNELNQTNIDTVIRELARQFLMRFSLGPQVTDRSITTSGIQ